MKSRATAAAPSRRKGWLASFINRGGAQKQWHGHFYDRHAFQQSERFDRSDSGALSVGDTRKATARSPSSSAGRGAGESAD